MKKLAQYFDSVLNLCMLCPRRSSSRACSSVWVCRATLRRRALKLWLVMSAATLLTVLPWTVRNYFVLGAFIPISTNSGNNFYIGNNPQYEGQPIWLLAPSVEWKDGANELEDYRRGLHDGLLYIWQHPARTVWM